MHEWSLEDFAFLIISFPYISKLVTFWNSLIYWIGAMRGFISWVINKKNSHYEMTNGDMSSIFSMTRIVPAA